MKSDTFIIYEYSVYEDINVIATVSINSRVVTVKGEHGTLVKSFKHLHLDLRLTDNGKSIAATMWFCSPLKKSSVRTVLTHINNMCLGVIKPYQFKMRLVYNHFPINTQIKNDGNAIQIVNFVGSKTPRTVQLVAGVVVEKSTSIKDELILTGINLESVSQSAALIHQSSIPKSKDRRKFLDGIYVSSRGRVGDH